jgi:hypothetical protein
MSDLNIGRFIVQTSIEGHEHYDKGKGRNCFSLGQPRKACQAIIASAKFVHIVINTRCFTVESLPKLD